MLYIKNSSLSRLFHRELPFKSILQYSIVIRVHSFSGNLCGLDRLKKKYIICRKQYLELGEGFGRLAYI